MAHPVSFRTILLLAALGIFAAATPVLAADQSTKSARTEGDVAADSHDIVQGTHVEGHIAFLKAEIGITPEQESLWEPVAAAMREDFSRLQEEQNRMSQKHAPENAIEYLKNRVIFANLRAQGEVRFLAAFQSLYNVLSPRQKQTADELLIPDLAE